MVKQKVSLKRAVERYREAIKKVKEDVEKHKKEKTPNQGRDN